MWLVIYQGKRISTALAAIANEILKECSNVQQKTLGLTGQVGTSLANPTPDSPVPLSIVVGFHAFGAAISVGPLDQI